MITFICLLLACSAVISASETALFSLPKSRVSLFKKDNCIRSKMVYSLLKCPKNLLVTLLMLNISINIAVQNVFSSHYEGMHWFYSVLCPLALTLVFGEILPKSIALCMNERVARFMAPFLIVIKFLLMPIRAFFLTVSNLILRLVSIKSRAIAPEEKIFALEKSTSLGLINEDESTILRGAASLGQIKVKEIMRLKDQMISQQLDESLTCLIEKFSKLECSKVVLFQGQKPLGIIHQEAFFKNQGAILEAKDLLKYVMPPLFVVDSLSCKGVLQLMRSKKVRIALVIDEYSSVIGLVTKEDLVERIVGQIYDKRDENKLYTKQVDGSVICSGKFLMKDLEEVMGLKIKASFESTTIGGVVTELMGDLPKSGSKIEIEKYTILILGVDAKRVKSLHVLGS